MTATTSTLSQSRQDRINELFSSRLKLVLFGLTLETLIMIPLMRTFLFIVIMFNLPAIGALVACTFQRKTLDCQMQKTTKVLLKVGIAKAIGGVLLALYMGLKYFLLVNNAQSNNKAAMKLCAIYLGASALVDVMYSIIALMAIKKTKNIIKVLRRRTSRTKVVPTYRISSSLEASSSDSASSSEEENSQKGSHSEL